MRRPVTLSDSLRSLFTLLNVTGCARGEEDLTIAPVIWRTSICASRRFRCARRHQILKPITRGRGTPIGAPALFTIWQSGRFGGRVRFDAECANYPIAEVDTVYDGMPIKRNLSGV